MLGFEPSVAVHLVLWYLSKLWLYCICGTWWSYYWWITARCYIHPPCSHRFHCSAFQYCKLTNGQFGICCDRSKHLVALYIYLIVNDQNNKLTILCISYWQYLFLGCFIQIIISIIGFVNCWLISWTYVYKKKQLFFLIKIISLHFPCTFFE